MSLDTDLIHGATLWVALVIDLAALVWAFRRAPWAALLANRKLQHLVFGATAGIAVLWTLRAGVSPGLEIHFLGVTTLTLMFGWELGLITASLALAGTTLLGLESWMALPISALLLCLIPVGVSYAVLRLIQAWLPLQFCVYLFGVVFFGSALAAAGAGLGMVGYLWLTGAYGVEKLVDEYLVYLPLILFPEALLNGILMTGMMVHYPDWIRTFDARRMIDEQ